MYLADRWALGGHFVLEDHHFPFHQERQVDLSRHEQKGGIFIQHGVYNIV